MVKNFTLTDFNRYAQEVNNYYTDPFKPAQPSKKVIRNLIAYSNALLVLRTATAGNVNFILN